LKSAYSVLLPTQSHSFSKEDLESRSYSRNPQVDAPQELQLLCCIYTSKVFSLYARMASFHSQCGRTD